MENEIKKYYKITTHYYKDNVLHELINSQWKLVKTGITEEEIQKLKDDKCNNIIDLR
jgi:DNA-binding Xre family transcriptional regulator